MTAVLHEAGYWVYGYRNFSSRIKGGYASVEIAFGETPLRVKRESQDVLVFLGADGWERDAREVRAGVLALADHQLTTHTTDGVAFFPFVQAAMEGRGEFTSG